MLNDKCKMIHNFKLRDNDDMLNTQTYRTIVVKYITCTMWLWYNIYPKHLVYTGTNKIRLINYLGVACLFGETEGPEKRWLSLDKL